MTPLQINMLLHFHCCADEFPNITAPAQVEAKQMFEREGLIKWADGRTQLTERGEAFVKFLCSMPLPVASWAIPGPLSPWHPREHEA